jgi:hypothetical protein
MLLGVAAVPASSLGDDAPLPDSRLGIRTVPLLLLSRPDVRADLGMNPAQTAEARRAISELHAKAASLRGKTGAEAIAARRAIDEEQRRRLEALLSPEQQDRLVQIDLQWEGPSALISRKMVAEALNLDDRQRATLAQAVSDRDRRRAQAPDRGGDERQLAEQALAILTEPQRARWRAMLGRPLAIPQLASPGPKAANPGVTR